MSITTHVPLIETILSEWQTEIGQNFAGYRGHVYRVYNFCLALHICNVEEQHKLAIAVCFHDLGLWSDNSIDYIPPSIIRLKQYLSAHALNTWSEEIELILENHHKIRTYSNDKYPLVEVFRQADLIDFSLGMFKFGLANSFIQQVKTKIPNAGFHKFLLRSAGTWFLQHPFSPPPFMKW